MGISSPNVLFESIWSGGSCRRLMMHLDPDCQGIAPPRVDSSKGCLLTHKGKYVETCPCSHFSGPWKKLTKMDHAGPCQHFQHAGFWGWVAQISRLPDFQISRFTNFQIPTFTDFQIPRLPDFQTPPAALPPDELSDPNLTPLPTHPRIKYVARSREPLLRLSPFLGNF